MADNPNVHVALPIVRQAQFTAALSGKEAMTSNQAAISHCRSTDD